jgi:chromosome segregation ATPase
MVKKRLSDLLQEEAEKLTPTQSESAIEVAAVEVAEDTSEAEESPTQTQELTSNRRTNPTKADLEVTIKELKETLEQSQKNEKTLQQQITELKSAASEQKASTQRLTKELDDAKKTVLQLAEANSKLIEENNLLKQEKENKSSSIQVKENKSSSIQVKEKYNPVAYRKSHRIAEKLPEQPADTNDDFANNTWLYD